MVFKIKTSKKTMEYFEEIGASENLAPFALSKLAISMSLKSNQPLVEEDFKTDNQGLELNRKNISDDEYFQKYLKAHLDRGAKMIYSEFKYSKDFLLALLSDDKGI